MLNLQKKFMVLMCIFALASCAGVDPKNLQPAPEGKPIALQNNFIYSVFNGRFEYTLSTGTYTPKYKSKSGTYYEGSGNCLTENVVGAVNGIHSFKCGIYIADKSADKPQVYFYMDPELSKVDPLKSGVLIAKLNEIDVSHLHIHSYQPDPAELYKVLTF